MDQEKVGKFIKKLRKDNNLTQQDLAEKLSVTYQAVSKWENGKSITDISTLKLISDIFNVNIDELLDGNKSKKKTFFTKKNIIIIAIIVLGNGDIDLKIAKHALNKLEIDELRIR